MVEHHEEDGEGPKTLEIPAVRRAVGRRVGGRNVTRRSEPHRSTFGRTGCGRDPLHTPFPISRYVSTNDGRPTEFPVVWRRRSSGEIGADPSGVDCLSMHPKAT